MGWPKDPARHRLSSHGIQSRRAFGYSKDFVKVIHDGSPDDRNTKEQHRELWLLMRDPESVEDAWSPFSVHINKGNMAEFAKWSKDKQNDDTYLLKDVDMEPDFLLDVSRKTKRIKSGNSPPFVTYPIQEEPLTQLLIFHTINGDSDTIKDNAGYREAVLLNMLDEKKKFDEAEDTIDFYLGKHYYFLDTLSAEEKVLALKYILPKPELLISADSNHSYIIADLIQMTFMGLKDEAVESLRTTFKRYIGDMNNYLGPKVPRRHKERDELLELMDISIKHKDDLVSFYAYAPQQKKDGTFEREFEYFVMPKEPQKQYGEFNPIYSDCNYIIYAPKGWVYNRKYHKYIKAERAHRRLK